MRMYINKVLSIPSWDRPGTDDFRVGDIVSFTIERDNKSLKLTGKLLSFEFIDEDFLTLEFDCSREYESKILVVKSKEIKNMVKVRD